jgi:hypothetical protein
MGWEKQGSKSYYTRTRRINGQVVREYVGTGAFAELAASVDAAARLDRDRIRAERKREVEAVRTATAMSLAFTTKVWMVMMHTMAAAGFHLHVRGTWRRRRQTDLRPMEGKQPDFDSNPDPGGEPEYKGLVAPESRSIGVNDSAENPPSPNAGTGPNPEEEVRTPAPELNWDSDDPLDDLYRRENGLPPLPPAAPDPELAPKPPSGEALRRLSVLGHRVEEEWIGLVAGRDRAAVAPIRADLAKLRAKLCEPDDPPLVQLLIDQYISEWTRRTYFSVRLSESVDRRTDNATREFLQRGADAADRKLMQLATKIATIRNLLKRPPPTSSASKVIHPSPLTPLVTPTASTTLTSGKPSRRRGGSRRRL